MKKLTALFSALVFCLCGCSSATPLTAQEYHDKCRTLFSTYVSQVTEFSDYTEKYDSGEKISSAEISSLKNLVYGTLDEIAALVPPEKYKEQHEKLSLSINEEKKWVDTTAGYLSGTKTAGDIQNTTTNFPSVFLETIKMLRDDGVTS